MGFSVTLEPVLELALVEQAGLELTEICLSAGINGVCLCRPDSNSFYGANITQSTKSEKDTTPKKIIG